MHSLRHSLSTFEKVFKVWQSFDNQAMHRSVHADACLRPYFRKVIWFFKKIIQEVKILILENVQKQYLHIVQCEKEIDSEVDYQDG